MFEEFKVEIMRNVIHNILSVLRINLETKDEYVEVSKDIKIPKVEILVEE